APASANPPMVARCIAARPSSPPGTVTVLPQLASRRGWLSALRRAPLPPRPIIPQTATRHLTATRHPTISHPAGSVRLINSGAAVSANRRVRTEEMMPNVLSDKERALMDAYWRDANYTPLGASYLHSNPR